MNLHEYQAKRLFAKHGVPIPRGKVATTTEQARSIARDLGGRVVVKSQVLTGGRGKAGGIKLANNPFPTENATKYTGTNYGELRSYYGVPKGKEPINDEMARQLIHGYYA